MTVRNEGIAELFFNMLKTATNPAPILAQLFTSLTGVGLTRTDISKLGHLVKVFGKTSVFFSIIDLGKRTDLTDLPYGLLYKICTNRLENAFDAEITISSYEPLEKRILEARKFRDKMKKIDPVKALKLIGEEWTDDK